MIPADNITLEEERRVLAKIELKRQQMEARKSRILNPRTRVIGLDTEMLDKQVAEKQAQRADNRRSDQLEKLKNDEIERVLAAALQEEKDMRSFNMAVSRKSWDDAIEFKRQQTMEVPTPDIDFERCGMSSATKFAGEDADRVSRLAQQKLQVRQWVQEQIQEKEIMRSLEREDNKAQSEILRKIDEVRESSEQDEKDYKRGIRMQFAAENTQVMMDRRAREAAEKAAEARSLSHNLPIVIEDKNLAMDANGRIIRGDMFKGFTQAQQRRILLSNQETIADQRQRKEDERQLDRYWAMQNQMSMRAMEQANQDEASMRRTRKLAQLEDLRNQIVNQRSSRAQWERDRFGSVGEGFFNGFGTSGR